MEILRSKTTNHSQTSYYSPLVLNFGPSDIANNIFVNTYTGSLGDEPAMSSGLWCADPQSQNSPVTIDHNNIFNLGMVQPGGCNLGNGNLFIDPLFLNPGANWFYAQHGPDFFSPNTSGVFRLGVMDNGDDRPVPGGGFCGAINGTECYSSTPVYQIDETAMTATLLFHYTLSPKLYSFFGGNVQSLANGDMLAAFSASAGGSLIQELTLNPVSPQMVWQAVTPGATQYRVTHLPGLYPGIQW